jgi:hypothetical protein
MSEIDPRKNAWLEHKATRECLDGLGAVPPCELDFQRGWNAYTEPADNIGERKAALFSCEYSEQNPVYCQQCGGHEHLCRKAFESWEGN